MEIRFNYQNVLLANLKLRKAVNKKLCGNNPMIKVISHLDPILFLGYYSILATLFFYLIDWRYSFEEYYGNNVIIWLLFVLLFGFAIITFYAVCIRPRWINRAFYKDTSALLKGESIIRLQPNGIFQKNNQVESLLYYSTVRSVENIEQYLVIFLDGAHLIIIPNNAFDNIEQQAEFMTLLKQKMAQNPTEY
ncbi:YcxB family protein [Actinobacillus minor]|uniref:YcxB family protein n=1 Tax=Actinobacillus minor TaxID=51047 RepID=UPI0023F3E2D5|nr:YcxB family protein [Actinobacillus minor]MDD6909786.1 YcxB family protein [Actinobacillus minor]MDY4712874.1 YcxB family protein [Actinobacillus minor]